ncbi:MAG: hypothetical protein ACRECO_02065 [Xanthobacteraceae bacterium]
MRLSFGLTSLCASCATFFLAVVPTADAITLKQMQAQMEAGKCPANLTRVDPVSRSEACGKDYYKESFARGCNKRVSEINQQIDAYNAFLRKCREKQREALEVRNSLARKQHSEYLKQEEERQAQKSKSPSAAAQRAREAERWRPAQRNAPAWCPKFPDEPQCAAWKRYGEILDQMSADERRRYLQSCCAAEMEAARRKSQEAIEQANRRAKRDAELERRRKRTPSGTRTRPTARPFCPPNWSKERTPHGTLACTYRVGRNRGTMSAGHAWCAWCKSNRSANNPHCSSLDCSKWGL